MTQEVKHSLMRVRKHGLYHHMTKEEQERQEQALEEAHAAIARHQNSISTRYPVEPPPDDTGYTLVVGRRSKTRRRKEQLNTTRVVVAMVVARKWTRHVKG